VFLTKRNTTYNSVERKHAPLAGKLECYSGVVRSGIKPAGIYEELMVRYIIGSPGDNRQNTETYNTMRCHGTVQHACNMIGSFLC
jgi:hypothetical protein